VYICRDDMGDGFGTSARQTHDMLQGACSIQYGGPYSLIYEMREWTYYNALSWLHAAVMVGATSDDGAGASTKLLLEGAHFYYSVADKNSLMLVGVSSNSISSKGAMTLLHVNFECCLQEDYRTEHGSTGGPQQEIGNSKTSSSNVQMEATLATC